MQRAATVAVNCAAGHRAGVPDASNPRGVDQPDGGIAQRVEQELMRAEARHASIDGDLSVINQD